MTSGLSPSAENLGTYGLSPSAETYPWEALDTGNLQLQQEVLDILAKHLHVGSCTPQLVLLLVLVCCACCQLVPVPFDKPLPPPVPHLTTG